MLSKLDNAPDTQMRSKSKFTHALKVKNINSFSRVMPETHQRI